MSNEYKRVGLVGRFRPLHNGSAAVLEGACERAEQVVIGIGSANKYNARNPFTAEETEAMIDAFLKPRFSNYSFVRVPDFAHMPEFSDGQKWRSYVVEHLGKLDSFISGNDYVCNLLKDDYIILRSHVIVPKEKRAFVKGGMVRLAMARNDNWKEMVPKEVADYLKKHGLVKRLVREFGLATIAMLAEGFDFTKTENGLEEKIHAQEK